MSQHHGSILIIDSVNKHEESVLLHTNMVFNIAVGSGNRQAIKDKCIIQADIMIGNTNGKFFKGIL